MRADEIRYAKDIPCVLADPEGLGSVVDGFMEMFDREVFDCIIASGQYSGVIAGVIASKMGRGVIAADKDGNLCSKALKQGWRTVLFTDVLTDGQAELGLIKMIEDAGCKVIRIGFIAEDTSFDARKSKVLKGYPFEAVADI